MRRLLPTSASIRSFLLHSGQTAGLLAVGVLAMAAAPMVGPSEVVIEAGSRPIAPPVRAVAEAPGPMTRTIVFSDPVPGHAVNSAFGLRRLGGEPGVRLHKGIDIAAPKGTGVFTAAEGEVVRTGYQPTGYGNFIEMRHPNGMTTLYAHLSRIDVSTGRAVTAGERIGLVGSTGYSTGPHLHFEVRRGDRQVNPARVLGRTFQIKVRAKDALSPD